MCNMGISVFDVQRNFENDGWFECELGFDNEALVLLCAAEQNLNIYGIQRLWFDLADFMSILN